MKALRLGFGAALGFVLSAPVVHAGGYQPYPYAAPGYGGPLMAPDACGPGFYASGCGGMVYGPNYCLYPGFMPFAGAVPPPSGFPGPGGFGGFAGFGGTGAGPGAPPMLTTPAFPTHPFARSPRDYFMQD